MRQMYRIRNEAFMEISFELLIIQFFKSFCLKFCGRESWKVAKTVKMTQKSQGFCYLASNTKCIGPKETFTGNHQHKVNKQQQKCWIMEKKVIELRNKALLIFVFSRQWFNLLLQRQNNLFQLILSLLRKEVMPKPIFNW